MSILLYYNGGDTYKGSFEQNEFSLHTTKHDAGEQGQVCYLSGFRYNGLGDTDRVYVFFREVPNNDEIERRRRNGLKRANLYYLDAD